MTNADKCDALRAFIFNHPSELEELKSRLLYLVADLDQQIERKRPGYLMDQRLGLSSDRPINAEDAT